MPADDQGMSRSTFRFKLERVREVRVDAEDRAREEFASSLSQRMRGIAMLRQAEAAVTAAQDNQRLGATETVTGLDLVARQAYVDRVKTGAQHAALAVSRADAEVDARRTSLATASRHREILERLKERHRGEHRAESERRDAGELDDMATNAYIRRAVA
jgi:flagellar export protein FliJ